MLNNMAFCLHVFECLAGEENYYSQDAAKSRSMKGNIEAKEVKGQGLFAILLIKKGTISTIDDLFVLN